MEHADTSEAYRAVARDLAAKFAPRAHRWDQSRDYCWQNVDDLVAAGIMGMTLPTKYGGHGASYYDAVVVVEEIAKACALSARIVVEANMGGISGVIAESW